MDRVDDAGITDAGSLLRRVAALHGDREAFVDGDRRLTFAQWDRSADAVAGAFEAQGVGKGDVVALLLPSCVQYAICYQAAMRLGAITTGVNPRLGPVEIDSIVARTQPRVIVRSAAEVDDWVAAGRHAGMFPSVSLDDAAAIVWTSGTTGIPKGAVFDHGCLRAMAAGAGVLSEPGDRRLSPLPFAHVGYMTRMWDELVHVITTVILPTPWRAADHLRLIEEERVTVGQGVPTQWQLVLALPELATTDVSSLRITSSGAATVPAELVRAMRQAFGAPVVVRYTSTEACLSTGTRLDDADEVIATTVGRASGGVELRIASGDDSIDTDGVGEVLVRSRAAMRGYWQDPAQTATVIDGDGWIHTGDLGSLDASGNLRLSGRRTEMYIRGGYNVYPAEVEATIGAHPSVDRVAVVGIPDPVLGQIGLAVVVPAAGEAITFDEVRAWCVERLANYKAPDRVVIADDLPLTAMSKVDKRALVDAYGGSS